MKNYLFCFILSITLAQLFVNSLRVRKQENLDNPEEKINLPRLKQQYLQLRNLLIKCQNENCPDSDEIKQNLSEIERQIDYAENYITNKLNDLNSNETVQKVVDDIVDETTEKLENLENKIVTTSLKNKILVNKVLNDLKKDQNEELEQSKVLLTNLTNNLSKEFEQKTNELELLLAQKQKELDEALKKRDEEIKYLEEKLNKKSDSYLDELQSVRTELVKIMGTIDELINKEKETK